MVSDPERTVRSESEPPRRAAAGLRCFSWRSRQPRWGRVPRAGASATSVCQRGRAPQPDSGSQPRSRMATRGPGAPGAGAVTAVPAGGRPVSGARSAGVPRAACTPPGLALRGSLSGGAGLLVVPTMQNAAA
jgi:hypothetical protein